MTQTTYAKRRGELETYFDRTASDAWAKLTSDAPVSKIRATVRAGRDEIRNTLLSWLPEDLSGARVLDAGCGPGQMSVELARRGADVLGVDLSPTLLNIAQDRIDQCGLKGSLAFKAGDMLDPAHGEFDYVVAMDSLIHYRSRDMAASLAKLGARTRSGIVFTFAPRTVMLSVMHGAGKLFPRSDKAPAIEPVSEGLLRRRIGEEPALASWKAERTRKVSSGFYISQAMELRLR